MRHRMGTVGSSAALEVVCEATASFGRLGGTPIATGFTEDALGRVVDVAATHRVAGCVGPVLRRAGLALPDSVAEAFDTERRTNAYVHTIALRSLARIASDLDGRSIRWAVFKGPVLASHYYGDVGARAYGDIDVFVHPADLGAATNLLERLGYEHVIRNWPLARWFEAGEFQMRGFATELDVHWHPLYAWYDRLDVNIDLDGLFERRRTVSLGSFDVPTFDAVDTLVLLALHASKSGGHRLLWLKDLERVVALDRPDFDDVVRRSHAWGVAPRIGLPLARAATHVDAAVPASVVCELLPAPLRLLDRAIAAVSPPLTDHERDTVARRWTRSMRSSTWAAAIDVVRRSRRTISASHPELGDESSDVDQRDRFMSEVRSGHGEAPAARVLRPRRVRPWERAALIDQLESLEPRTTSVVGMLQSSRWPRTWVVRDRTGAAAAVYSMQRMAFDSWQGAVFVQSAAAAPSLGRVVDRACATSVRGPAGDVLPIASLVARTRQVGQLPRFVAEHPIGRILGAAPSPRTRVASMRDLDHLVALYSDYEIMVVPTAWQLRAYLRRLIRAGVVVVYDDDGEIVAALALHPMSTRYCEVTMLIVRRGRRREGMSWDLLRHAAVVAESRGLGAVGEVAATNPMSFQDARVRWSNSGDRTHTAVLHLSPLRRFRGHGRLRHAYQSVRPVGVPAEHVFRDLQDPEAVLEPPEPPSVR